jgi:hypothetical protein
MDATPRALSGPLKDLLKRTAYSPWWLMNSTTKPAQGMSPLMPVLVVFLSVVTIGILPAVFWSTYLNRRRRLKPFFQRGIPGTARVIDLDPHDIGFGEKLVRVRYEFEVEGKRYRGADDALPSISEWWEAGTIINILYLPDQQFDSVIVAPL